MLPQPHSPRPYHSLSLTLAAEAIATAAADDSAVSGARSSDAPPVVPSGPGLTRTGSQYGLKLHLASSPGTSPVLPKRASDSPAPAAAASPTHAAVHPLVRYSPEKSAAVRRSHYSTASAVQRSANLTALRCVLSVTTSYVVLGNMQFRRMFQLCVRSESTCALTNCRLTRSRYLQQSLRL